MIKQLFQEGLIENKYDSFVEVIIEVDKRFCLLKKISGQNIRTETTQLWREICEILKTGRVGSKVW